MITLNDLKGKNICITGEFKSISRARMNFVLFAHLDKASVNHVSSNTDFLFVADECIEYYNETGCMSSKLKKAVELKAQGSKIRFLSEKTWHDLFGSKGCLKELSLPTKLNQCKLHNVKGVTFKYEH